MMKIGFVAGACVALFGCTSGSGEVKLGVDVAAIQRATDTTVTASALQVERVRVLVAVAKVGYAGGGDSTEAGPYVVELTADEIANGAHREVSLGELPSGTYGGAEIEIDAVGAVGDSTDASLADFVSQRASVLVDGTYDGAAFSFAGHFLAEQGTDGEVTIDASTPVTLAMTVDPSTWFQDASGALVNPGDATLHDATAVALCKTLDTQPQRAGARGGRGGDHAHCVEGSP